MFRDKDQLARACSTLLATASLERLWTRAGPTPEAIEILKRNGAPLADRHRVVFLATWAFWNGQGAATLADILQRLDPQQTEAVCTLIMAAKAGADAIDAWLFDRRLRPS